MPNNKWHNQGVTASSRRTSPSVDSTQDKRLTPMTSDEMPGLWYNILLGKNSKERKEERNIDLKVVDTSLLVLVSTCYTRQPFVNPTSAKKGSYKQSNKKLVFDNQTSKKVKKLLLRRIICKHNFRTTKREVYKIHISWILKRRCLRLVLSREMCTTAKLVCVYVCCCCCVWRTNRKWNGCVCGTKQQERYFWWNTAKQTHINQMH